MAEFSEYYKQFIEMLILYIPVIVKALVVLFVGLWIIKWIKKFFEKFAQRSEMDESLKKFLSSLISLGLKLILIISVISMMGVASASFVAIIGAAGLAIGLSLQGSLANLAGGVLILLFKPFKVGDFIETQGFIGKVAAIEIFNTILMSPDNKRIILPNGAVSNGPITNFSAEDTRRVDFVFGIGYQDDINKAKTVLQDMVSKDERVLKDPETQIVVSELADSSVNITVRVWCKSEDYWGIYFDMQEGVKKRFDAEKISIPFPQTDVHLYKETQA